MADKGRFDPKGRIPSQSLKMMQESAHKHIHARKDKKFRILLKCIKKKVRENMTTLRGEGVDDQPPTRSGTQVHKRRKSEFH